MFLALVVHFRENLRQQVKGRRARKLKSVIEDPVVTCMKVQVLRFTMKLSFLGSELLYRVIHFGENLGKQVKGRPARKLKSLIEVPYVTRLKIQVLRFNMILISSP